MDVNEFMGSTKPPRLPEPKGGSGKTTATILLAGEFANAGLKTLIIDADPQASASIWKRNSEAAGYRLDNITVERITDKSGLPPLVWLSRSLRGLSGSALMFE